jgi:transposase
MDQKRISDEWRIPDKLWERIEPLLPKVRRSKKGGRPPVPFRQVMDGIFYVLRTGCQWKAVPPEFGSGSTLHRRFQQWVKRGVFRKLWRNGLLEYDELKGIQWDWQSIDGAMTKAPLGGEKDGPKPHRSGQIGHEAKPAYRWRRRASGGGRQWRQHARQAVGRTHAGKHGGRAA